MAPRRSPSASVAPESASAALFGAISRRPISGWPGAGKRPAGLSCVGVVADDPSGRYRRRVCRLVAGAVCKKVKKARDFSHCCLHFLQGSGDGAGVERGGWRMAAVEDRKPDPVVEGADQGSMASLVRRLARLDAGRLRLHDLPADHAADREGIRRAADRGDGGVHDHPVDAAGGRHRLGLARRSDRAQDAADDLDRLVLGRATSSPAFRRPSGCCSCSARCSASAWARNGRPARRWRWRPGRSARAASWAGCCKRSWGIGFLLSSAAYGLFYNSIGWRGLLMIGVLPALSIVYVRRFVKEPRGLGREPPAAARPAARGAGAAVQDLQARAARQHADGMLVDGQRLCRRLLDRRLFATHLQKDLQLSPALVALPIMLQSLVFFLSGSLWGWLADRVGRRWAIIIPAVLDDPDHAALSDDRRLHDDRRVLHDAGRVRRRRHARPVPGLSRREISDRGARDGERLLSTTRGRSSAG